MAITATFTQATNGRQRVGRQKEVRGEINPVGTYVTGGFSIPASLLGLGRIDSLTIDDSPNNGTEFMVANWIQSSGLVKLGWTGAAISTELDEITNADTTTGFVFNITARGA